MIDAKGYYSAPGFVDIHTHGGGGYWFYEEPTKAAKHFLLHGEITIFPALYFNLTLEEYLKAFKRIRKAMKNGTGKTIKDIYMEGPYLNPKYGSDQKNNKWAGKIDEKQYNILINEAKGLAKVWCIAPGRGGIENFVEAAKGNRIIFSAAHSEATPIKFINIYLTVFSCKHITQMRQK